MQDLYYQTKNREFIQNEFGKTNWIQIGGNCELNGADATFWCALIDKNSVNNAFEKIEFDISIGDSYESQNGLEPLLYKRDFYGVKESYTELSQEFILFNNLYYDKQESKYFAILDNGDLDEVVRIKNKNNIFINLKYLVKYAAYKQMVVILNFDIMMKFDNRIPECNLDKLPEYKNKNIFYEIWWGNYYDCIGGSYSVLMGKKLIYPNLVEKKEEFIEFIIGLDENGNEKTFTCNPDKLANYFGKNPNAPHYLTPIFFKKEVLQKYANKPELYSIEDGRLKCKYLWGVAMDNHHKDKDLVSIYLGDIGRDLPESERTYWRSFNCVSDCGISEVSFKRDFLAECTDSDMIEHKFGKQYNKTNKAWLKKFGWSLFLPLAKEDEYNFSALVASTIIGNQAEFDNLVLSLVKVLIDSLNEKQIKGIICSNENITGSISLLEKWLKYNSCKDYEKHIQFLRNLQNLRSSGTGHRKGKNYDKIATYFGIEDNNFKDVFESILTKSYDFLKYMHNIVS